MVDVAGRQLTIGGKVREIGELVPEATSWPNRQAYLDGGFLVEVETKPKKKAATKTEKPDYSSMTVVELSKLVKAAGFAPSHKRKVELIELLTE